LLALNVVDEHTQKSDEAHHFGEGRDSRDTEKDSGPHEEDRGADDISFEVNQRVFHGAMTHPTASVRVIGKIGAKA
jgi:hypothetical protein